MKKWRLVTYLAVAGLFITTAYAYRELSSGDGNPKDGEELKKVRLLYRIGSDEENEDFYDPAAFAVDADERIYVLDTKNSRVQCFSKEGAFLFSFGRFGQGPGELSKEARVIRILEDGNIYIIDVTRTIKIYNRDGRFIKSIRADDEYNDIEMIDGKYYVSTCYMELGARTIHVLDQSGKEERSFGVVLEPEEGINARIAREPKKEMLDSFFNSSGFSRIVKTDRKELIYSLFVPYRFMKYDLEGRLLCDVSGNVEYGQKEKFSIVYKHDFPFIMPNLPLPRVFYPVVEDDGTILFPFLKKERDDLFIDRFGRECGFIQRYKISERIATAGNEIIKVHFDRNNNLYCLIKPTTSDDPHQIVKYRLLN
jgi:hypothetical protein